MSDHIHDKIIHLWLAKFSSASTVRQYARVPGEFEAFAEKAWWQGSPKDVADWAKTMAEQGKSKATIAAKLSALSSLYTYSMKIRKPDGSVLCSSNPVATFERPKVKKYGRVGSLDVEQILAILQIINHRIARSRGIRRVVHLRNRAMFLFYCLTGMPNSDIRNLKGGDLRQRPRYAGQPEIVEMQCEQKGGGSRWDVIPSPAWQATAAYLVAANRQNLGPDDYVFIGLEDPFGSVQIGRPITDRMVRVMVSRYARQAGVKDVTVRMLRHTSALLLKAAGASVIDIQRHLGHSHLNTTQIYMDQLESQENNHWVKVADMLGLTSNTLPNQEGNKKTMPRYPLNLRKPKRGV